MTRSGDEAINQAAIRAQETAARNVPSLPDLPPPPPPEPEGPNFAEQILGNSAVKSFLRSAASAAGREISRNIFGTGSRRRR